MGRKVSAMILLPVALMGTLPGGVAGCAARPGPVGTTQASATLPAAGTVRARHRPLLMVFAGSERDDRLDAQRRQIGPLLGSLAKRGVMVVEVVGDDPLRRAYAVPDTGFHVRLVDAGDEMRLQTDDVASSEQIGKGLEGVGP